VCCAHSNDVIKNNDKKMGFARGGVKRRRKKEKALVMRQISSSARKGAQLTFWAGLFVYSANGIFQTSLSF
jgi:hypothetical protein